MTDVQRWDYTGDGLEGEVPRAPWPTVAEWVSQAEAAARDQKLLYEPCAMAVATVDASGMPNVRTLLMRFLSPAGPGFVGSRHSQKAREIEATGVIAATLTWSPLFRSLRFRGRSEEVDEETTHDYWRSRPWGSRISAWASRQSHPVASRAALEELVAQYSAKWPDRGQPDDVPVPPDWVGYRIRCQEVELWAGRPDRLHDRVRYRSAAPADLDSATAWEIDRLQP